MNFMRIRIFLLNTVIYLFIFENIGECTDLSNNKNWDLLPRENCGRIKIHRIFGGIIANFGQYPWMTRLAYKTKKSFEFKCGGVLINQFFVLTAGHCVSRRNKKKLLFVRLGDTSVEEEIDCEEGNCVSSIRQDIYIKEIILHKKYNFMTDENDIALLALSEPAKYNDYVTPICLPQEYLLFENFTLLGEEAEVAGWGQTDYITSYYPSNLMYVTLPIVDMAICKKHFPSNILDSSKQLCVGAGKGKDSCEGDSGGPLMKRILLWQYPTYFLFGIISYGAAKCGEKPAIYTNVLYYMEWILDNIGMD